MLIYLLKATLVWGLSLLLFEGLLRKNSFHAANRFYLLGTLLAGLLLPLVEVEWTAPAAIAPAREAVQTAATATKTIVTPTDSGAPALPLTVEALLLFIYATGFGIAFSRIVRDGVTLARLRHDSGREALPDGCTLYETGAGHGPFSFFSAIFLSSRDAYTASELAMVISHERQHARLLHSADMLFVQTLKVLLWFHPLVHVYSHRLRLVHEYEADSAAAQEPAVYGRFLVEQALASPALTLTHAFHSPLKTRIAMLTQNKRGSGRALRYALILPVTAALVVAFSQPAYTDDRKLVGNKLSYGGNEFTMTDPKTDTMYVEDVATGETKMVITTLDARPVSVNGETIYDGRDVVRGAEYSGKEESETDEFFARVSPILGKLPDGFYRLSVPSVVVSKEGKLIYHAGAQISACYSCKPKAGEPSMPKPPTAGAAPLLPLPLETKIKAELANELARGFRFTPAEIKGKPVNAYLERDLDFERKGVVVVQDGKARMRPWD